MATASHWAEDRARGDTPVGEYRRPLRRPEVVRREGTRPCGQGPFPSRGHAGSPTAAKGRTRSTNGCGEWNRPGDETRGLTRQRSGEWERPRAENQLNYRPACRSDRRRPDPHALESLDSHAHHTESPAAFTTAELREDALVLRRRFGLS
ncbi:hypothetical protein NDU88_005938 [Pleurodeles waltl]|uniref:Uncharacterized protein n=1 Tax=Pleurodeles waltl TaxID=8319 RepID=A0AAV7NNU0_PLEWA|nr:hypothetical protein NDU88_005938 [Pleurodeles waltl]